jgi:1,4-alpha-glucan branching enzyme
MQTSETKASFSLQGTEDLRRLIEARHHDPFDVLGKHTREGYDHIRALIPGAAWVRVVEVDQFMTRIPETDFFEWRGRAGVVPDRYRLHWQDSNGREQSTFDPYCFTPQLSDFDLYLFGEGKHRHAYRFLGAHELTVEGILGVRFAVWAPNAERVSVIGDFNHWDGRRHSMRVRGTSGIWELFIPELDAGELYKFELRNRDTGTLYLKRDPYGQAFESRPGTASIVTAPTRYQWADAPWMQRRIDSDWLHRPMSIYEVHPGSWRRSDNGTIADYRTLARQLVDYAADLGFTHIELLPVTEHPLDDAWGYQTTGYFAPTSRYGSPDDFRYLVDHCHQHEIGVLIDWTPGHFPDDSDGLAKFDGTALYEHQDPRGGGHPEPDTLRFNFGRNEVRNFLISSAVYWLEEFHVDGLRVDGVASMLYHDYEKPQGEWIPTTHGGHENIDAIDFLRELNHVTHGEQPGSVMIAEEATGWPKVTKPTWLGGLGFSMKWNTGWLHDTLEYLQKDPVHRHYHHNELTFGILYAFTENFVLAFSHEEVTHGKGSMLDKMPGDAWRRFATLRLLYTYTYTYPGKKLLFMGNEFGQASEWNHEFPLRWEALELESHRGVLSLVRDLNHLYRDRIALYEHDFDPAGFEWIDCQDALHSIISYLRRNEDDTIYVALNFTPVPRHGYRLGVPSAGRYKEILNSDSGYYGGTNVGNGGMLEAEAIPWMGRPYSIVITLPPLAGIVLQQD